MKRITQSKENGYAVPLSNINEAAVRLGEYEDTELSPEEIIALKRERDDWFRRYNELMLIEGSRP